MKSLKLRTLKKTFWHFQEFRLMYHLERDLSMKFEYMAFLVSIWEDVIFKSQLPFKIHLPN